LRRFEKILQIENEAEREAMFIKELQSQIPVLQAKRDQTLYERYLIMSGRTSMRIPDEVRAKLKQLSEGTIKETPMDKASQDRAEHIPIQTRHQILDLTLNTLRNQPPKKTQEPT
jgi:hypothetical protein